MRLVGTILGAAVPQLITEVGPWHRLRASLAIVVTASALFVAYGGFAIFAFASDNPSVVPLPHFMPNPNPGPGIAVSTHAVDCGSWTAGTHLCDTVTVKSTGSKPLRVDSVEITPHGLGFSHDQNCVRTKDHPPPLYLPKGATCTVQVSFEPSGAEGQRSAQMIIHENIATDNGVRVAVHAEVKARTPVGNLVASLAENADGSGRCEFVAGVVIDNQTVNAIRIWLAMSLKTPTTADLPTRVHVSTSSETLPGTSQDNFPIDAEDSLLIPVESEMYDKEHFVRVTVDPNDDVPEFDEDDNDEPNIKVYLPAQPEGVVPCKTA